MICDVVVDALGTVLVVIQVYPDGSYNCPSCHYGVQAHEPHCQNPACFTRPGYPAEHQRRAMGLRVHDHEEAMQRIEDTRVARSRDYADAMLTARMRGCCERCASHSLRGGQPLAHMKLIRHRGLCPRG